MRSDHGVTVGGNDQQETARGVAEGRPEGTAEGTVGEEDRAGGKGSE